MAELEFGLLDAHLLHTRRLSFNLRVFVTRCWQTEQEVMLLESKVENGTCSLVCCPLLQAQP